MTEFPEMDPQTSSSDSNNDQFNNFYNEMLRPQINELANMISTNLDENSLDAIEEFTDNLFGNLEHLDSESLLLLEGYKVVSRSYLLLKQQRMKINKEKMKTDENENEDQAEIFKRQNEELLSKFTQHIENRQEKIDSLQELEKIKKEFNEYKESIDNVVKNIGELILQRKISNVDDLQNAFEVYHNETTTKIARLEEELENAHTKLKEIQDKNNNKIDPSSNLQNRSPEILEKQKQIEQLKDEYIIILNENKSLKEQLNSFLIEDNSPKQTESDTKDHTSQELRHIKNEYQEALKKIEKYENQIMELQQLIEKKDKTIFDLKKEAKVRDGNVVFKISNSAPKPSDDKIFIQQEYDLLKEKYDNIVKKNNKYKSKLKKFSKIEKSLEQLQNKIKRDEELQRIEIQQIQMENDDLKAQLEAKNNLTPLNNELSAKSNENKILSETIDKLSNQLKEQCIEIENENQMKSTLLKLIERQSSALCEYERIVMDKENKLFQNEAEINKYAYQLNTAKQQEKALEKDFNNLIGDLIDMAHNNISNQYGEQIAYILANRRPQDIISAFELMSEVVNDAKSIQNNQNSKSSDQNDKLYQYLLSLTKQVRSIAYSNRNNLRQNITPSDPFNFDDTKNEILQQCRIISAFIQENAPGLVEEPTIFESFGIDVDETMFIQHVSDFVCRFKNPDSPQSKELYVILTYLIGINEILRKTAQSYREQCEATHLKNVKLQEKLNANKNIKQNKFLDDPFENDISKTEISHNEVDKTKTKQVNKQNEAKSQELNKVSANDIKLSEKYNSLKTQFKEAKKKYTLETNKMKKKSQILMKQNEELRKRIEAQKSIAEEVSKTSEKSNSTIKVLQSEIENRNFEIEASATIIKKQREEIDALKQSIEDLNNKIREQLDELEKAAGYSEDFVNRIKSDFQKEISKLNKQNKILHSKFSEDLKIEKTRNENLKSQYEPIILNLREKLNESRTQEMRTKFEFNSKDAEIKDLKAKIQALNVENKVIRMKVSTLEEKASRERELTQNQNKAQQIAMQQQLTSKINDYETKTQRKEQAFYSNILEQLHEYCGNNETPSSDSVKCAVHSAVEDIKRLRASLNDTQIMINEMNVIRTILKPNRTQSLSDAVQKLIDQRDELISSKGNTPASNSSLNISIYKDEVKYNNQLQNVQNSLKEWDSWARKLFAIVTETASAAKSDKELRKSIEEIVLGSLGQNNNAWIIESLRKQKKILKSRVPLSPIKSRPSIGSILVIYSAIRRMQKMSGHLHSDLAIPNSTVSHLKKKKPTSNNANITVPKKYPIISTY